MASFNETEFRSTVANYFQARAKACHAAALLAASPALAPHRSRACAAVHAQLDTSQVVINQVYPKDSGTAVQFYAIFADRVSSLVLMNFLNSASRTLHAQHCVCVTRFLPCCKRAPRCAAAINVSLCGLHLR